MLPEAFDLASFRFAEPQLLWLLVLPALLSVLWLRVVATRLRDRRRFSAARLVPWHERFPVLGDAPFWLGLIAAVALLVMALAQPKVVASMVRTGGADVVILLDASASMHVTDVPGNRWKRSVEFLRSLGDTLSWQSDRIALTLFAHIAAPQVRLTNDPNTFFFFLDHLADAPPFRLEDDSTWDTNIGLGIAWGLRVIEKDEEIRGPSKNAKLFILISDGQSWSGTVEEALGNARRAGVPVFVLGVGTDRGGIIPDPKRAPSDPTPPIVSRLDRASLTTIATAGGGQYFEMDRGSDVEVATRLIDAARRRAASSTTEPLLQDVYWQFLAGAALCAAAGVLFVRERPQLWLQGLGLAATLSLLASLLR